MIVNRISLCLHFSVRKTSGDLDTFRQMQINCVRKRASFECVLSFNLYFMLPPKSCPIPSQLIAIAQLSAHANVPRFPAYSNQKVQRQLTLEFHSKLSISLHSLEIVPNWIFYPIGYILSPIRYFIPH